jgi:hypothetical protein
MTHWEFISTGISGSLSDDRFHFTGVEKKHFSKINLFTNRLFSFLKEGPQGGRSSLVTGGQHTKSGSRDR